MPIIEPRSQVNTPCVGSNPVSGVASSRAGRWQRFAAACSRIAESFLSESNRLCGGLFDNNTPSAQSTSEGLAGGVDSAEPFKPVKMLVDDKVTRKVTKRRMTLVRLRNAGPEFKSSLISYQKNLEKTLPTIIEKDEYTKTSLQRSVKVEGGQVDGSKAEELSLKSESNAKGLADQFAAMEDFDFSGSPNQFPAVLVSNASGDTARSPKPVRSSGMRRYDGKSKIVDYVPSTFPVSRQQMTVNFRGKIIAENFMVTRQLNIHNEVALTKLLSVLERSVTDKSVALLDAMSPSETFDLFEHFCTKLKVSPFRKGHGDI